MRNADRPLSYWTAVARISFENDLNRLFELSEMSQSEFAEKLGNTEAYVSQILNGKPRNYTLKTLAKLASVFDAIVQIRLITEGEVTKVVDYETSDLIDSLADRAEDEVRAPPEGGTENRVVVLPLGAARTAGVRITASASI